MTTRALVLLLAVFAWTGVSSAQRPQASIEVFKDPSCGCCSKWVDHLRSHGFAVTTTEHANMDELKASRGVPQRVRSCHTAVVGNYVVEGHVPAADVQRLLAQRPAIAGIGVPGMPIGSPGMEVTGMKPQAFDVIAFAKDGSTRVFASHGR